MGFQKIAKLEDLWSGEILGVEMNGEHILLLNIDDQIYAYADVCPHQRSRLSEGTLTEGILRCARHHWEFDALSGLGVNPRNTCLKTFPVVLDGEDILINIDSVVCLEASIEGQHQG
jgi:toluene monooxygenase system ferredoxin subunit